MGTSIFVSMWNRWHQYYHARLAETVTIYDDNTLQFFEILKKRVNISSPESNKILDDLIINQAFMLSLNDVFYLAGWLFLILIAPIWACSNEKTKTQEVGVIGE